MQQEDLDALATPAGAALLDRLTALPAGDLDDQLQLLSRLRAEGASPELAAAALTQARLRARAAAKFGPDAARMIFTPAGLEQATRWSVAGHRAARLAGSGATTVADLGCGIGADTIAFARTGLRVVALERDPLTAAVARANVEALGQSGRVEVRAGDALDVLGPAVLGPGGLDGVDAAFVDPARRGGRGRVFDPDAWSPPFSFVAALAERVPRTVAKVAPGIPHDLVPPGVETEWVSERGEVKEAVLWHGPLTTPGVRRRATLLPSGRTLTDREPEHTDVGEPAAWLHEPDGAVVRAGLVGQVAALIDGRLIDPTIAYVTTGAEVVSPFTHRYAIVDSLPFGLKPLRAALRRLGYGDVVVKKRGSAIEPAEFRRRLKLDGNGPTATVVVTRLAGKPWTFITQPRPTVQ